MAREPAIVEPVRTFLGRLQPPPTDMVVAVSGGPDSVALLRVLAGIVSGRLVVAHLNHCLRGPASDADEAFVGRLVEALRPATPARLEFCSDRRDVAAAAVGDNLEAVARRIRYDWLADVAKAEGVAWVATGHTADDQAETVLFRLLRGAGLAGLAGIAPRRPLAPGVELVRPLLNVTRADVLTYLESLGQDYREDASNADHRFARSRIRHELLPLLAERYNPRVRDVLCRLAEQAADARREIDAVVVGLIQAAERPRAGPMLVFDRAILAAAPRPRLRSLWRRVWEREGWPRQAMGFAEWDRLAELCGGGPEVIDLPGRIRARRRGAVVQIDPVDLVRDASQKRQ
jgi:tRNA(Ile)-lysidine synthase